MGKNNKLINTMKQLAQRNRAENVAKASGEMVPQIYAALAMALHRECGWGYVRINRLFVASQRIWENFDGTGDEMVSLCEKETGIAIIGENLEE